MAKPDVILSEEHVGYEFLPYEQAVKRATFAAAKELLRAAYTHITADTPADSDKLTQLFGDGTGGPDGIVGPV